MIKHGGREYKRKKELEASKIKAILGKDEEEKKELFTEGLLEQLYHGEITIKQFQEECDKAGIDYNQVEHCSICAGCVEEDPSNEDMCSDSEHHYEDYKHIFGECQIIDPIFCDVCDRDCDWDNNDTDTDIPNKAVVGYPLNKDRKVCVKIDEEIGAGTCATTGIDNEDSEDPYPENRREVWIGDDSEVDILWLCKDHQDDPDVQKEYGIDTFWHKMEEHDLEWKKRNLEQEEVKSI